MPVSGSNDKARNAVITHSTIHGHIHTFDGDHRHIHGHIHKHRHSLPSHIDANVLIRQEPQTNDITNGRSPQLPSSSTSLSVSNPSNDSAVDADIGKGAALDLTHCQIQQIIDQCCHNTLDNCFDCTDTDGAVKNADWFDVKEPCVESSSDVACCNEVHNVDKMTPSSVSSSNFTDFDSFTPESKANSVGSPIEIKNQLQSIFDSEMDCFDPNCIVNEATHQGDKCFEFCDFDNLPKEVKAEKFIKLEDFVTDIPDSYNLLKSINSSSKLSDVRTEPSKIASKTHKHIHAHNVLHHCLDDIGAEESRECKKRKVSSNKVEQFHYNWIDLNDTPLELAPLKPEVHKDHLHCLWSNCSSNLLRFSTNEDLRSHVLKDHILKHQSPNFQIKEPEQEQANPSLQNSGTIFECEWLDCDFKSDDILQMLEHIPSDHGFKTNKRSTSSTKIEELDGVSNFKNHNTHHHHHHHHHNQRDDEDNDVDPDHTCKWEFSDGVFCNEKFNTTEELTTHLTDEHIGGGQATYICKWENCSRNHKKFNQRQKILRHLHVHTKHRPCVCKLCGKKFAIDLMLEQHMRIHTGEKPFQCSICAKWFKTSSALSVHQRVHSGEKPLVCKFPGCNKRFNESSNLNKHLKVHQRKFKCHFCTKSFNQEKQLDNHLRCRHWADQDKTVKKLKLENDGFRDPLIAGDGKANGMITDAGKI